MDDLLDISVLVQDESFIHYCIDGVDKEKWEILARGSAENKNKIAEAASIVVSMYQYGLQQSLEENEEKLKVRLQQNGEGKIYVEHQNGRLAWPYWSAVAVFIVMLGFFTIHKLQKKESPTPRYLFVKTRSGEQKKIVFPDSTVVWMDGGTKIKYSDNAEFDRKITLLEGHIACSVKHDDKKAFVVTTNSGLQIKDLGTLFSVFSKKGIDKERVDILEGSVQTLYKEQQSNLPKGTSWSVSHSTGEQMATLCGEDPLAWRDGFYRFQNMPLQEFIANLQDAFDVQIILNENALTQLQVPVSSSFHNTDNVSDILSGLETLYGLKFKQKNVKTYMLL